MNIDQWPNNDHSSSFFLTFLRYYSVTAGILVASAANLGLAKWDEGWRLSYGGNIAFALILLVCLVFMPESPRWLAAHASDEDLARAMKKVHYEDEVEAETKKLLKEMEEEKELGVASWSEVFTKDNHVFLGMSFQAFQQVTFRTGNYYFLPTPPAFTGGCFSFWGCDDGLIHCRKLTLCFCFPMFDSSVVSTPSCFMHPTFSTHSLTKMLPFGVPLSSISSTS